eukprot:15223208-Heterocapsa_arctica.AAC.1
MLHVLSEVCLPKPKVIAPGMCKLTSDVLRLGLGTPLTKYLHDIIITELMTRGRGRRGRAGMNGRRGAFSMKHTRVGECT